MNIWLKRAIGAAGIAVGFLLWQGSPAGASELVEHPLASAAKSGNAAGVTAVGDTAGRVTSGNLGEVETSTWLQVTTGKSEHSGSSGGAVKSSVTLEGSEVRIAAKLSARGRGDVPEAERAVARTVGEGQRRLLVVVDGVEDDVGPKPRADQLVGECLCGLELEHGNLADEVEGALEAFETAHAHARYGFVSRKHLARRAQRGRELTVGVKVSGHARLLTGKVGELQAKAGMEVEQGHVGLKAIA